MSNVLLVSFAGYPYSPTCFLPDNGLAGLAASLLKEGYECKILDYGTVDVMERLSPGKYGEEVFDLSTKIITDLRNKGSCNSSDKERMEILARRISEMQDAATHDIGKEVSSKVKQEGIGLVGFKLWSGDGLFGSIKIAEEIRRKNPSTMIIAGGPQVNYFMENIFDLTHAFDALAYGEGEETIHLLAKYAVNNAVNNVFDLAEIPNLLFRKNGSVVKTHVKRVGNLDALPTAVYDSDIYPAMEGNHNKIRLATIDETRGCFHGKCTFCNQPFISGHLRKRSAGKVVGDMKQFVKEYGISVFNYAGSATPTVHAKEIAEEIHRNGLDVEYGMFCIAKGHNKDSFELLKKSGLRAVFFGGESGSPEQLKSINKLNDPEELKHSVISAKQAGIYTAVSFIFPLPGETAKTEAETLQFIQEMMPDSAPITPPAVTPNTHWGNNPEKYGVELNSNYLDEMMRLKIKVLFPAILWSDLPYTIDGLNSNQLAARSAEFSQKVREMGITTFVSHELMLLAKYAGMSAQEYIDKTREDLIRGNHSAMRELVSATNANLATRF